MEDKNISLELVKSILSNPNVTIGVKDGQTIVAKIEEWGDKDRGFISMSLKDLVDKVEKTMKE